MPTFFEFIDPTTNEPHPVKGMGLFLTQMSGTDPRLKVDRASANAWLDAIGRYDLVIAQKAFAAHYRNQDLAKFTIRPDQARAWIINNTPKRPRCPDHPSYFDGPTCGGCRADRLELGLEKAIGSANQRQITSRDPVPMPDAVRAQINETRRRQ